MNFGQYRSLLAHVATRRLLLVAMLARIPHTASAMMLTIHVVGTLGLNYAAAGGVTAAATVGIALGAPWRGRILDRKGLRRALVPSIFAELTVWPIAAFLPYPGLLVAALLGGALTVPIFTVVRQSLGVMVPQEQRRTAYALDSIGTELLFMVGPTLGVLTATWNSHLALIGLGVAASLSGTLLYLFNPPTRSSQIHPLEPVRLDLSSEHLEGVKQAPKVQHWFTLGLAAALVVAVGSGMTLTGTDIGIVAMLRNVGQQDSIGIVLVAWGVTSVCGGLVYGALPWKIDPLWLLLGLGLTTIPMFWAVDTWSLALLVLPAGLLCAPVLSAASERVADLVDEEKRGEAMGWYGSSVTLGNAAGAPVTGGVIDLSGHPGTGFAVVGGMGAMLAACTLGLLAVRNAFKSRNR